MRELEISTLRELEDMVIECIYQGLVQGKLDQQRGCVEVQFAVARDISPNDVATMIQQLTAWCDASEVVLRKLQTSIDSANLLHEQHQQDDEKFQKTLTDTQASVKAQLENDNSVAGNDGPSILDFFSRGDDSDHRSKRRPKPRRG
eukprot:TRINITY_DN3305_c0_g1_i5.p1 TRINITY_DN3305_c0_g1~~TRINITY_DN3305_c0_g1_i5.p1  ORF type:complete len:146 (+),score=40.71 TRINITY_DN3305_c0_g1_i5:385-822(+)